MDLRLIHGVLALLWVPLLGNLVLAGWAGITWRRGRRMLPPAFWGVLLVVLAALAVQAAAGVVILLDGARPRAALHLLYGLLVAGTAIVQYGLRPGALLRRTFVAAPGSLHEAQVMTLVCFFQFGLLVRAWTTAVYGR